MVKINGVEIPEKTVLEDLLERNKNNFSTVAFEFYGKQLTYGEFFKEVFTYAKAFSEMGIKKGDVVTLCMPGTIEFIVSYYALNYIGATANCVSINFLNMNLSKYTDEKQSKTLVIFDKFYDMIKSQIPTTSLENIIITNIADYMPENVKQIYIGEEPKISEGKFTRKNFNVSSMSDFIRMGSRSNRNLILEKYDSNRDNVYLYTSGTTGNPKCAVFKDLSPVSLVTMHESLPINDAVGDRSLLIIPPYYATSLFYEVNLQLARGLTIVLQPNYDKNTFGANLRDYKINRTLAAMSHYAALFRSDLSSGDLANLKIPGCGGEAVTYGLAQKINKLLSSFGAQDKMIIGGGQTENGSCIFEGYTLPNRVNETGNPLPGVFIKIIDPDTGKEVKKGQRGELIVSSPAAMDRYYEDISSTNEYFHYDEDGTKWGAPKDICFQTQEGPYRMLGRASDSYKLDKKRIYMFDTEEKVSEDDAILECEAVALPMANNQHVQVLHIVMNPDCIDQKFDVIKRLCEIPNVAGIKIRDHFDTSKITGKRDTASLINERSGYYFYDADRLVTKEFTLKGEVRLVDIDSSELESKGYQKKFERCAK